MSGEPCREPEDGMTRLQVDNQLAVPGYVGRYPTEIRSALARLSRTWNMK